MPGPAYAKPPRDTQRAAIDKTFLDLLGQAQQLKGSVFDTPKDAAMRNAWELAEEGPQAGILVPKAGMGAAFTPAELEAQRLWGKYWPKVLEALKNDKRPRGQYVLDLLNRPKLKGETEAVYNDVTRELHGPIKIRLNPKKFGMETGLHEADHAFNLRKMNTPGSGNQPVTDTFRALDPDVRDAYMILGQGDAAHAATYMRADDAAKRLGLVPNRGASFEGLLGD